MFCSKLSLVLFIKINESNFIPIDIEEITCSYLVPDDIQGNLGNQQRVCGYLLFLCVRVGHKHINSPLIKFLITYIFNSILLMLIPVA